MALDVIVASTDRDLTTTGALKALLYGATATSTVRDAALSRAITQASRWAESYIGYPVTVQTYRETLPGYGRRRLMLGRTPLLAIKAFYQGTDTDDAVAYATSELIVENRDAGFLAKDLGFEWSAPYQGRSFSDAIPLEPAPMSGQEYRPWLVDYVAGWTYAGIFTSSPNWSTRAGTTSTGRTLPEDVELAVLLRAQSIFQNRGDVAREKLGDIEVEYKRNYSSVKDDQEQYEVLLAPYRRLL